MIRWIKNKGKQPCAESVFVAVKYFDGTEECRYSAGSFDWNLYHRMDVEIRGWLRIEDYKKMKDEEKMNSKGFTTKDSGKRAEFESGMKRDTNEGKARFELLMPLGIPYKEQLLTRFAELMGRGAEKYSTRNWEQANSQVELERFKESAFRHFMQWQAGEADEDHAAAIMFNIMGYESTKYKMENK